MAFTEGELTAVLHKYLNDELKFREFSSFSRFFGHPEPGFKL